MMTLLAVNSWYAERGREEEQGGVGEMDRVGVRQAGGRGGDRPVCRVEGLSTERKQSSLPPSVSVPLPPAAGGCAQNSEHF